MSSAARPPFERAATPPVAQSRVAGKVESSPLQIPIIKKGKVKRKVESSSQIPTIARIDGKTVRLVQSGFDIQFNQLLHLHGELENVCFIGLHVMIRKVVAAKM